jgi:hypothetical protein
MYVMLRGSPAIFYSPIFAAAIYHRKFFTLVAPYGSQVTERHAPEGRRAAIPRQAVNAGLCV